MNYTKPEIVKIGGITKFTNGGSKWLGIPTDQLIVPNIFLLIPAYEVDE